jgi:hypothetical protein
MASSIEVAFSLDSGRIEPLDRLRTIEVEQNVVMPRRLVRMKEQDRVRKIVVVINDIGQICHCFSTFVLWYVILSRTVIHSVYAMVELGQFSVDPRHIFIAHPGHDDGLGVLLLGHARLKVTLT